MKACTAPSAALPSRPARSTTTLKFTQATRPLRDGRPPSIEPHQPAVPLPVLTLLARPRLSILWTTALIAAAAACVPLIYLIVRAAQADADTWSSVLRGDTVRLLLNTVALAAAVTAAATAIAIPCAWLTERTDLPGARWWRTITVGPLAVPSYVAALAVIAALGPSGSLQRLLAPLGVDSLPELYGFAGAWLVLTLFTYPYILLVLRAGPARPRPGAGGSQPIARQEQLAHLPARHPAPAARPRSRPARSWSRST